MPAASKIPEQRKNGKKIRLMEIQLFWALSLNPWQKTTKTPQRARIENSKKFFLKENDLENARLKLACMSLRFMSFRV